MLGRPVLAQSDLTRTVGRCRGLSYSQYYGPHNPNIAAAASTSNTKQDAVGTYLGLYTVPEGFRQESTSAIGKDLHDACWHKERLRRPGQCGPYCVDGSQYLEVSCTTKCLHWLRFRFRGGRDVLRIVPALGRSAYAALVRKRSKKSQRLRRCTKRHL